MDNSAALALQGESTSDSWSLPMGGISFPSIAGRELALCMLPFPTGGV
jgi:hypothetical protein